MSSQEEKKRKRLSNGVGTPNKKVAFSDNIPPTIRIVERENGGLYPALISTSGLNVPLTSFQPFVKQTSRKAGDIPQPSTHDLLLHSSQHARLDFTAAPLAADQELAHYIAVYDPETEQMSLTPAHSLSLHSTLRSETQEVARDEIRRTYAQQKEDLGKEFGTKKAQKAIADKTINAITTDVKGKGKRDDVQTAILEAMGESTSDMPGPEQTTQNELAAKPIPKPNLTAETVEKVYPFSTLVPAGEARLLTAWQDASNEAITTSNFIGHRMKDVLASGNVSRIKALQYLDLLLEFHNALQGGGRKGKKVPKKDVITKKIPGHPEQLIDTVRRRFGDSDNELSKWHQDNLYTHICALTLFVDGWTTEISDLKHDLKLDNRQLSQYYHELGCKVNAPTEKERATYKLNKAVAAVTRVAKLKLPLDFPKPRIARRR